MRVYRFLKLMLTASMVLILCVPQVVPAQLSPDVVQAAKKEGEVVLYGAVTIKESTAIGERFEKKYGVKLKHWRGDATEIINRVVAEGRS